MGVIIGRSESPFGFYIVELENGIRIVAGTSAFRVWEGAGEEQSKTA